MTEITYSSGRSDRVGIRGDSESGPFVGTYNLQADEGRFEGSASLGLANNWEFDGGTLYLGAGMRAEVGFNYRPSHSRSRPSMGMSTYTDRINVPQAVEFLREAGIATSGSYDPRDLKLGDVIGLMGRYPAVLKPNGRKAVHTTEEWIKDVTPRVESARLDVLAYLQGGNVPAAITARPEYARLQRALEQPFTLDNVRVGEVGNWADNLARSIGDLDGAERTTARIDSALNRASDRLAEGIFDIADRGNPPRVTESNLHREARDFLVHLETADRPLNLDQINALAERLQRPLPLDAISEVQADIRDLAARALVGLDEAAARADSRLVRGAEELREGLEALAAGVPHPALNIEQLAELEEVLTEAERAALRVAKKINDLPTPKEIRRYRDHVNKIAEYDASVDATGYVAAAYDMPMDRYGVRAVVSAMAERGVRVDPDNLWLERNPADNELHPKIYPSSISSGVVAVGFGTHPSAAMPDDVARPLGIRPSDSGSDVGVHFAFRSASERLNGHETEEDRLGLVVRRNEGLGDGNYGFAEVEASKSLSPNTPGDGTSVILRVGRTL